MAATSVLPTLSVPKASLSLPLNVYPSSPMAQFPPPAPVVRRPLRERPGFTHTLKIHTTFTQQPHQGPWQPKGHIQPHRSHLPRRRKIKRIVLYEDDSATEPKAEPEPVLTQGLSPSAGGTYLQEVVPGLFIAFKLSDDGDDANKLHEEGYTHIIDIRYASASYDSGAVEDSWDGRLKRLRLILPSTARPADSERAGLALSDAQLRAARDYLAQALPYSSAQASQAAVNGVPPPIRILLSTPPRRPTDAMSIVGCYLAFASKKSVEVALRCVDDEEHFLSIWKSEVCELEVERLERVARMWSWLSSVKR